MTTMMIPKTKLTNPQNMIFSVPTTFHRCGTNCDGTDT